MSDDVIFQQRSCPFQYPTLALSKVNNFGDFKPGVLQNIQCDF